MKTVFYNATLHKTNERIVEGIISEENLTDNIDYKGESWDDFYYAVKKYISFVNDCYNITMNQFSKLDG